MAAVTPTLRADRSMLAAGCVARGAVAAVTRTSPPFTRVGRVVAPRPVDAATRTHRAGRSMPGARCATPGDAVAAVTHTSPPFSLPDVAADTGAPCPR